MKSAKAVMAAVAAMVFYILPVSAGTLYHVDSFQSLTADARSFRAGDALTVMIVEASSAESRADSTGARAQSVDAGAHDTVNDVSAGIDLKRKSNGQGSTARAGRLQGQISVRVQDVAANGDLAVYGTQKITVNGETQTISVAGVVRPIDVSSDNVVLSTRLSNAEIVYSGRGFVDRSQKEGWLSRMFGLMGL